jgi:phage protein D
MPRTPEQVFIAVDGSQVDLAAARLIRVVIDQALVLPDAFTLGLAGGLEWLRDDTFAIGKEVKIEMTQGGGSRRTLIVGEVTGLLPELNETNEAELVVRGYDRSHRLQRGRYTRAFIQLTDSDIAQRIATEMGLGSDIEPTDEVYDHVFQQNQTNLEFLQERAARIGYQVGVSEGDLYFKPVGQPTSRTGGGAQVRLSWGEDLWDLSVSRTTPGQATEVTVRGWDPVAKKAVVGQASSSSAGPATRRQEAGGEAVRSAFSIDAPMTVVREGITSQAEAENLAQVICDELHGAYTTAEGVASGNPDITPGATVEVQGAGVFDGRYIVSSATHRFDRNGYQTRFAVGGARPPARIGVGEGRAGPARMSFAIGIVTNNEDEDDLGRVKVKFPTLADDLESYWCRLLTPMAGGGRGFFALPEVNDEVMVAFEQGASPVIIGALWNGVDKPPLGKADAVKDGKVVQRIFKSRAGHQLLFDDTEGEEQVVIKDKKGNQIVFECKTDKLVIKTAGDIEVEASGKLSVAAKGDMTLSTRANMTIEASGNLDIKGTMINLNP